MFRAISNLLVLAIIVFGAYFLWTRGPGGTGTNEQMDRAERSCIDEIRDRFDTTAVKANSVRENADGFVVKATMTLSRGKIARATCLTNHNGAITDVSVYEH